MHDDDVFLAGGLCAVVELVAVIYSHLIAAAAAAVVATSATWWLQSTRYTAQIATLQRDHAQVLQGIADKTARAYAAVQRYSAATNTHLAELDSRHQQELSDAQSETNRLRACVRAGTCGVRIITRVAPAAACDRAPDQPASGMGDAAVALDAAAAERVLDLRESIQSDAAKLAYLQQYASACWRAGVDAQALSGQKE